MNYDAFSTAELDMAGCGEAGDALLEAIASFLQTSQKPATPLAKRVGRRWGISVRRAAEETRRMSVSGIVDSMRSLSAQGLQMPLECGIVLLAYERPWCFEHGYYSDFREHVPADVLVSPSEHAALLLFRTSPSLINFERFPGYRGPRRGN